MPGRPLSWSGRLRPGRRWAFDYAVRFGRRLLALPWCVSRSALALACTFASSARRASTWLALVATCYQSGRARHGPRPCVPEPGQRTVGRAVRRLCCEKPARSVGLKFGAGLLQPFLLNGQPGVRQVERQGQQVRTHLGHALGYGRGGRLAQGRGGVGLPGLPLIKSRRNGRVAPSGALPNCLKRGLLAGVD